MLLLEDGLRLWLPGMMDLRTEDFVRLWGVVLDVTPPKACDSILTELL